MDEIFHDQFPEDAVSHALPGTRPMAAGDWLRTDERFAEQMALRDHLIAHNRSAVIGALPGAQAAVEELFDTVCDVLSVSGDRYERPDGVTVPIERDDPLATLGRLCQEDLVVMTRGEDEHILAAAVLCFPSRWTLAQKLGRPLTRIHRPVAQYDDQIARRVQRLFDGVQVERPIVRWNYLPYSTSALFNPGPEPEKPYEPETREETTPFIRMERQVVKRLPETRAVIFSIHTYITRA